MLSFYDIRARRAEWQGSGIIYVAGLGCYGYEAAGFRDVTLAALQAVLSLGKNTVSCSPVSFSPKIFGLVAKYFSHPFQS